MTTTLPLASLRKVWNVGFLPGFLFWVAFLLVLEPDNVARAVRAGYDLTVDHELLRILGAGGIGGLVTPLVLSLTRRRPVAGSQWWRNAVWHALMIAGLAFAMIVSSCFAAAWGFGHRLFPPFTEVVQELISNWTLLLFALTCLTAIAHAVRPHAPAAAGAGAGAGAKPTAQVLVNSRGRREWIAIADVDWIESQGNYVTLHVGTRTHWVRQSLGAFETQLDRTRFARIHRRTIVALDRIRDIQAEGNGDASIRLQDGSTLRVSRRYRKDLGDRWLGFRAAR